MNSSNIFALSIEQRAFVFFEESSELPDVGGVSRDREWRQPLLDLQIVEETGKHAGIGFGRHTSSMQRYRTLGEVIKHVQ